MALRILVVGCGFLGGEFAAQAVRKGHQVWGLRRRIAALPEGVLPFPADVSQPLPLLPPALDAVVYAISAGGRTIEAYQRAYVDGITHLAQALATTASPADPRPRLLFVSSTSVYGEDTGAWIDETTPADPGSPYGEILLAGEEVARQAPADTTIVRFSGIYGPGRDRLIREVAAGATVSPEPPEWTNRIHRDDGAALLLHLLDPTPGLPIPADSLPILLGVDEEPAPRAEVYQWLARRLGAPEPKLAAPSSPRRGNKRCSNALLRSLGFRYRYPSYREGYEAMLAG